MTGMTRLANLADLSSPEVVSVVGDGTHLSVKEVVALTGDSESTVRRLFDAGTLTGYVTERGGHRRILKTSVDEFLAERGRRSMLTES